MMKLNDNIPGNSHLSRTFKRGFIFVNKITKPQRNDKVGQMEITNYLQRPNLKEIYTIGSG